MHKSERAKQQYKNRENMLIQDIKNITNETQ